MAISLHSNPTNRTNFPTTVTCLLFAAPQTTTQVLEILENLKETSIVSPVIIATSNTFKLSFLLEIMRTFQINWFNLSLAILVTIPNQTGKISKLVLFFK